MHRCTVQAVLEYQVRAPTHFCFTLEAAHWPTQTIHSETLAISSGVSPHHFVEGASGNRMFRFDAAAGPLMVNYRAEVDVHTPVVEEGLRELPVGEVPDEVLRYLLPTRYCEADLLGGEATWLFGDGETGLARVRRIVRWIHDHVRYQPGSTDSTTTAGDVYRQRAGVCRDFAHLGVTFCRALNIPARLVAGYVWFDEPPQDFHAVFEAWLDGRWVMFDATGMAPVDRLVRIATGSDAKAVAFATFYGSVEPTRMQVGVLEHDPRGRAPSGDASLELAAGGAT